LSRWSKAIDIADIVVAIARLIARFVR